LVDTYFETMRAMPVWKRFYVGTVNLDRNRFVVVDLKSMVDRSPRPATAQSRKCVAQSLLASAAVPIGFPPRFVDNNMYADGNVRHGVFASLLLGQSSVRQAMADKYLVPYVSVIVNGNQSADSYRSAPAQPVKNTGIAIASAAVENVLDQVDKDSTYQIENDLIAMFGANNGGIHNYWSRYTYVANATIQQSTYPECREAVTINNDLVFDPVFMKCLYKIGYDEGQKQAWRSFFEIPPPTALPSPVRD
jgi:hypothetical protein